MTNQAKPQKEKVFLAQLNRDVVLNFITLRDDEWMLEKFGEEKLASAFTGSSFDLDVVLAIFYRVLNKEDKESILKVKVVEENPENPMELLEIKFDDPVKKIRAIISGQREITEIMQALVSTRIKSNPAVVEMLKKKLGSLNPNQETLDGHKLKT